jgi:hypothetical protein
MMNKWAQMNYVLKAIIYIILFFSSCQKLVYLVKWSFITFEMCYDNIFGDLLLGWHYQEK